MSHLVPCTGCSRHVLESEPECPFCGTALQLVASPRPRAPNGARRAQLFALGASLAAAACGDQEDSPPPDVVPISGATATQPGDSGDTRNPTTGSTTSTASAETSQAASTETNDTSAEASDTSAEASDTTSGDTSDTTPHSTAADAGAADAALADASTTTSGSSTGEHETSTGADTSDSDDSDDWSGPSVQPLYGAIPVYSTRKR